jgi:CheY-like chemotaxis protein
MTGVTPLPTAREHVSVVVADDNPVLQGMLEALLGRHADVRVVAVCSDGATALERVLTENADVALLDDDMPRMSGLRAAEVLRTCIPRAEPILFTAAPESFADEAAAIGVRVISKLDSQHLVRQILEASEEARARPVEPVKERVATRVLSQLRESSLAP